MQKTTSCMSIANALAFEPPPNSVLISIRDRDDMPRPNNPLWVEVMPLSFVDVAGNVEVINMLKGYGIVVPTEKHGKAIAAFIRKHYDKHIYVHCEAGKSRSAAVVEILRRLGWRVDHPRGEHATEFSNPRLLRMLLRQFPELLPIGVEGPLNDDEIVARMKADAKANPV